MTSKYIEDSTILAYLNTEERLKRKERIEQAEKIA
jgi:hypothetical protein